MQLLGNMDLWKSWQTRSSIDGCLTGQYVLKPKTATSPLYLRLSALKLPGATHLWDDLARCVFYLMLEGLEYIFHQPYVYICKHWMHMCEAGTNLRRNQGNRRLPQRRIMNYIGFAKQYFLQGPGILQSWMWQGSFITKCLPRVSGVLIFATEPNHQHAATIPNK